MISELIFNVPRYRTEQPSSCYKVVTPDQTLHFKLQFIEMEKFMRFWHKTKQNKNSNKSKRRNKFDLNVLAIYLSK